jgi:hypothetical protein
MKRIAKDPVGLSLKKLQLQRPLFLFKRVSCVVKGPRIGNSSKKELKSKFKLQIITIFALSKLS